MAKTIEELREESARYLQTDKKDIKSLIDWIHETREEIVMAFIAKYRLQPDEIVQVSEPNRWYVTKKNYSAEWIDVNQEMPYLEPGETVLVYLESDEIEIGYWDNDKDDWSFNFEFIGKPVVTHWMPLPEPPK